MTLTQKLAQLTIYANSPRRPIRIDTKKGAISAFFYEQTLDAVSPEY